MSKGKLTIQRTPCYVEGDWESVVDHFQKVLRKDRQTARDVAGVEKARALNHAKGARIQLYDMDVVKVWKGRETLPCWAKYGLSDPHSDPNNLRNTLAREIGVGVHMSPKISRRSLCVCIKARLTRTKGLLVTNGTRLSAAIKLQV